jgi:hypothetical protein
VPGDAATSLVLHATSRAGTQRTTVPVTLRTMIPTGVSGGHFHGLLTGGNGRGGAPAQTDSYAFVVPPGERDLDVGLAMATNRAAGDLPGVQLVGMLVDPDGDVVAYDSNFTVNSSNQEVATRFLDLYRANPAAGTWLMVLQWVQPVSGVATAVPFAGSVEFNAVSLTSALPDAPSAVVGHAGQTFDVVVHNAGVAPMLISPDARLTTTTSLPLHDVHGYGATQGLPDAFNVFDVPSETSALSITTTASVPATFDASFDPGDPDLSPRTPQAYVTESWSPTSASLTYTPPDGVSAGLWNVVPSEIGPYPARGEPHGTETTSATVTTLGFDPTVSSTVPDSAQVLVTGGTLEPAEVAAGQSADFPVTITPTDATGTVEHGTLFVNGLAPGSLLEATITETSVFMSDLAAIPYEYTVGP